MHLWADAKAVGPGMLQTCPTSARRMLGQHNHFSNPGMPWRPAGKLQVWPAQGLGRSGGRQEVDGNGQGCKLGPFQ